MDNELYEMIASCMQGTQNGFERLMKKILPYIRHRCNFYLKTKDGDGNEHIVEEISRKVAKNISGLKKTNEFMGFLNGIIKESCIDHLRKRIAQKNIHIALAEESIPQIILNEESLKRIWESIDSLSLLEKQIIRLRYLDQKSIKKISQEISVPEVAVKKYISKAKNKIRESFKEKIK